MEELQKLLSESQTVLILTHIHPDGDAIGSLLGLNLALKQLGKTPYPVVSGVFPETFAFLPSSDSILKEPRSADLCILLDMSDLSRTGFENVVKDYAVKRRLITIDHHPKGDLAKYSTLYLHNQEASSTGEMITRLLIELGIKFTSDIATCLLTGIYTDTGGFQHQNTKPETLDITSELMQRGAKLHTIAQKISRTKSVASLKLLGVALERMMMSLNRECATSLLTYEDFSECNASEDDVAGIVNEINSIPGIKMSLLLTEYQPGIIRGTLRSGENHKTPVNLLAKLCGGGGHPQAAGFSMPGHLVKKGESWQIIEKRLE